MNKHRKLETHDTFFVDNKTITNPDEIANAFNNYFINVGSSIAKQCRATQQHNQYLTNPTNSRFAFKAVTEVNILKIIDDLKNKSSYGHDSISNKLIKRAKLILVKPLTFLVNQTLRDGVFQVN